MIDPDSPVATLDSGGSRSDTVISIYFVEDGDDANVSSSIFDPSGSDEIVSEGWSEYEKTQFMAALAIISNYVDLTFVETTNADADFQVVLDNDEFGGEGFLGYFYQPSFDGDNRDVMGAFNENGFGWNTSGGLEAGGLGFSTIIHEVLHGLGLDHPHDGSSILNGLEDDASRSNFPFGYYGDYELNQGVYTIMSYNDGWNETGASFNDGNAASPMALDIAMLQEFYGANTTYNSGNNVYEIPDDHDAWIAIWDTGGEDTISYSGTKDVVIDLREATLIYGEGGGGFISAADGVAGGFTIADGAVIENATGGTGNDLLMGNGADNELIGNGGSDAAYGGAGDDTVSGGSGSDALYGDSGTDEVSATSGSNTIYGGSGFDTLTGGTGVDTVYGGSGDDDIDGGGSADNLYGGRGDDTIAGGTGGDTITGGLGADELTGDSGADTFVFQSVSDSWADNADTITDFATGTDTIDLSGIDANLGSGGDQAFDVVTSFSGAAGELRLDTSGSGTTVLIDRDGDGTAEMQIIVQGATLTESDFIL